ncbi:27644_t:CDS:2, partial [Dentiscutata erythropus]
MDEVKHYSSQETSSSVEVAVDITSTSNTFGKDIVEIPFSCDININKTYYEAWNEIIKSSKNETKYNIQDYSSKVFAPWSIILWSISNALCAILISIFIGMVYGPYCHIPYLSDAEYDDSLAYFNCKQAHLYLLTLLLTISGLAVFRLF